VVLGTDLRDREGLGEVKRHAQGEVSSCAAPLAVNIGQVVLLHCDISYDTANVHTVPYHMGSTNSLNR
jgi:hypothetical protein